MKIKPVRAWAIGDGKGNIIREDSDYSGTPFLFECRSDAFDACNINGQSTEKPILVEIRPIPRHRGKRRASK